MKPVPVIDVTNVVQMAERYEQMRNERLAAQQALDLSYQEELTLKDSLINFVSKQGGELELGDSGYVAKVTSSDEPFITDFTKLAEYIKREGALDLLQKRLTPTAVKLRWRDGLTVPGIGTTTKFDLKILSGE